MSEPVATGSLAGQYDVALLDLDGVVYLGDVAVAGASEALARWERLGLRRVFVTNNASRTPQTVARQLVDLGVPADAGDIVTSAQAAAGRLESLLPAGARVLVVGGEGLVEAVRERGLTPASSADDDPAAVVQGFSPTTTWQMLMGACVSVRAGRPWIVTNADATLPTPRGEGPGNGALVDVIRTTVHRDPDEVTGKPFAPIMAEALRRRPGDRPLVVGDRLDTDIEAARAAGMDSLLVLTGVTGMAALLTCPPERRPTYVAADLAGLLEPAHRPQPHEGWWCCGDVAVRLRAPRGAADATVVVDMTIAGERLSEGRTPTPTLGARATADLLHAAAAARWSWPDPGAEVTARCRAAVASWAAPYGWDR
jgi:HAD superfamily hydrolase (TIGR01450 family)